MKLAMGKNHDVPETRKSVKALNKNAQVDLEGIIMDNNKEESLQPIKKHLQSSFTCTNHNSLSNMLNNEGNQFNV